MKPTTDLKPAEVAPKQPLFARFVQSPKVRTGLRAGLKNPV
jgi:hypothetical protein